MTAIISATDEYKFGAATIMRLLGFVLFATISIGCIGSKNAASSLEKNQLVCATLEGNQLMYIAKATTSPLAYSLAPQGCIQRPIA